MNFDLSEEQLMLADQTRRLLAEVSPSARLRGLIESQAHYDDILWPKLAEYGLLGAAIPEAYGGVGLGPIDMCVVAEEIGRAASATPFASSISAAAQAIEQAGNESQKQCWLPQLASGECIATFAYAEGAGEPPLSEPTLTFENGQLNGEKWPVADAQIARIAVVLCQAEGVPALAIVDLTVPGTQCEPLVSFDSLKPHAKLRFANAPAEILAIGSDVVEKLFNSIAISTAFEQVGGADACVAMAADYVRERRAFGRAIGSYQGIKHKLANCLVAIELARSNAYFAAWALTSHSSDLSAAAAAARLSATEAYELAARECLHVHGGIGYTWDADCQFHYRRARLLALSLGSTDFWSHRLIDALKHTGSEG
jgi:acyl-CoA dehydrogenase